MLAIVVCTTVLVSRAKTAVYDRVGYSMFAKGSYAVVSRLMLRIFSHPSRFAAGFLFDFPAWDARLKVFTDRASRILFGMRVQWKRTFGFGGLAARNRPLPVAQEKQQ